MLLRRHKERRMVKTPVVEEQKPEVKTEEQKPVKKSTRK